MTGFVMIIININVVLFQVQIQMAKPILRRAIEMSLHAPYWHCRLLFQLAVSGIYIYTYVYVLITTNSNTSIMNFCMQT